MMLQFECWAMADQRVIVEWNHAAHHDFWWGRWRPVKWLPRAARPNPEHQ